MSLNYKRFWTPILVGMTALASVAVPQDAPSTKQPAIDGLKTYLDLGGLYERHGRLHEAEIAYAKAAAEGRVETAAMAKLALDRVAFKRGAELPEAHIDLGDRYRKSERFAEAETAYTKALDGGTAEARAKALVRLKEVIAERETFYLKYAVPVWEVAVKAGIAIIAAILGVLLLKPVLAMYGRWRFRNAVGIRGFSPTSQADINRPDFAVALAYTYDRMRIHSRGLVVRGESAMPALVRAQSSELVELLEGMNLPGTPVVKWWHGAIHQPAYRISGSVEWTTCKAMLRVKLERSDRTLGLWSRECILANLFQAEQDLAYEVLMKVKEDAQSNAP